MITVKTYKRSFQNGVLRYFYEKCEKEADNILPYFCRLCTGHSPREEWKMKNLEQIVAENNWGKDPIPAQDNKKLENWKDISVKTDIDAIFQAFSNVFE